MGIHGTANPFPLFPLASAGDFCSEVEIYCKIHISFISPTFNGHLLSARCLPRRFFGGNSGGDRSNPKPIIGSNAKKTRRLFRVYRGDDVLSSECGDDNELYIIN